MKNIHHPRYERTLVILKPDAVQRGLIGEMIHRYERVGLKLAAMKMMQATPKMIYDHYMLDPEWMQKVGEKSLKSYKEKGLTPRFSTPLEQAKFILARLENYYTSGPVVLMIWEGAHAVAVIRKITGGTEPLTSDVGTIRGDFVIDSYKMADDDDRSIRNLVHASGSVKEAKDEIGLWFSPKEILDYTLIQEKILYDVNIDGTPE